MTEKSLQELLDELHSQIETARAVSPEELNRLRDLEADIRSLLERNGAAQPSLLHQLEERIAAFEVSHPVLAAALSEVAAILSNAGI
jgi:hypothetical protein